MTACLASHSSPNCVDAQADVGAPLVDRLREKEMAEPPRDTTQLIRPVYASTCERRGEVKRDGAREENGSFLFLFLFLFVLMD